MKKIFISLLLACSFFSFAQNQSRKGSFQLQEDSQSHELYVSFYSDSFLSEESALKVATKSINGFQRLVDEYSISLERGIPMSEQKLNKLSEFVKSKGITTGSVTSLRKIYKVKIQNPTNDRLYELAKKLEELPEVEYASLMSLTPPPPPFDIVPTTENMIGEQRYLGTDGVDMLYAWSLGLNGQNIRLRDVEYGFNKNHEELNERNVRVADSMSISKQLRVDFTDHGTSVIGIMFADTGDYGIKGMAYGASEVLFFPEQQDSGYDRIGAVTKAIASSTVGDVILLELQMSGRVSGDYIPAEYDKVIWTLTKAATDAGIIIVATAGNGNQNLDDTTYAEYMSRGNSGAIMVGAGGSNKFHRRMYFSTYGSRLDVQGWGENVLAPGFGKYSQNIINGDTNQSYNMFAGTSSAAPIVASCVAVLQSYYHGKTGNYLTPLQMRNLLVETGTPQQGAVPQIVVIKDPIGPIPNMRKAIKKLDSIYGFANISDIGNHNDLCTFYPNPFKDELHVNLYPNSKNTTIEIVNMDGQKIFSSHFSGKEEHRILNLKDLSTGIYFMKINSGKNISVKKIIKQ